MEDGPGACAFLAQAAAALTVLSLLPLGFSGTAPSHASAALLPISSVGTMDGTRAWPMSEGVDWATGLFASFTYEDGRARGQYMQFDYDETRGGTISSWFAKDGWPPILFFSTLRIEAFIPSRAPAAAGPIFTAGGYLVEVVAHDDPTGLLEVRTLGVPRTVTIELPTNAANLSQSHTPGSWPVSSLTYMVGTEQARLFLGDGTFVVVGTTVFAQMGGFDLLVFKAVPAFSQFKAEWNAVLDAIQSGAVVAEVDLVTRPDGGWIGNLAQYRMDVAATVGSVVPRKASLTVTSARSDGAVVLLGFDNGTMPLDPVSRLKVEANGLEVSPVEDTLALFYAPAAARIVPMYAILPLPWTMLAVYLPSLSAVALDVQSIGPPPEPARIDIPSQIAMVAALAVVSLAAAVMFRRRAA